MTSPSGADHVRFILKLLLLNVLMACGAPGSDAVFLPKAKAPKVDSAVAKAPAPAAPRFVSKQYSGWYRRIDDTSQFQPCGAKVPLDVRGTPINMAVLRDRYRFSAPWLGAKMFSVFHGAIVTDTLAAKGAQGDSARRERTTRFVITGVDSMRAMRSSDCAGVRAP